MNPRIEEPRVSIVTQSPGLDPAAVEVVVTLPTFRRPDHLLLTLSSLREQTTARRMAVIVMENDADGLAGAEAARPLFEAGQLAGLVLIAHQRGNCSAYNAGWETALNVFPRFRHLLVIDDDEVADAAWIETMCATAERLKADIVGAPQEPVFQTEAGRRAEHPVFQPPYRTTGRVPALYSSGNLLLRRGVLEAMGPPFLDLRFNFLGGGDSDFLSRSAARGFRLAWCAEAPVHETVPARRLDADWIRARSRRNGVISTLVEKRRRQDERFGRPIVLARSLGLLAASPLRGLKVLAGGGSPAAATYPFHVALGRLLAEFGHGHEQYREPEKN